MATDQLIAPLASLELTPGMSVKFEAIHPTTGAAITGVKVTNVAIYGDDVIGGSAAGDLGLSGPFMLTPGPGATT